MNDRPRLRTVIHKFKISYLYITYRIKDFVLRNSLVSNKNSDATYVRFNGGNGVSIKYNEDENDSNMIMLDYMCDHDFDAMNILGMIGLLGKPSKHFPISFNRSNLNWTTNDEGYPERLRYTEDEGLEITHFTWK